MKRPKQQPSVLGLLLIVTGMLLLSILAMNLAAPRAATDLPVLIGLGGSAGVSLVIGAALSARKAR
jgi:hypothetical protein